MVEYKKKVKLILFDLDGTLVDSLRDITNALNHAIGTYGIKPLRVEETKNMVGEGITRLVEKVLAPDRIDIKDEVLTRFLEYYSVHLTDDTRPYPEVEATLAKLNGYIKAVISNKREALSRRLLEELGLAPYFLYIIGSDSTPEKKPSPIPIITVLKDIEIRPEEAMMVGDSNLDIEAGKRAGVITVSVGYGYGPLGALEEADFLIKRRLSELLDILKMFDYL